MSWYDTAYNDIQTKHQDWGWMRTSASFATINGQAQYTTLQCGIAAGTFGMWDKGTFRNYVTSVGTNSELFMDDIGYDEWRDYWMYGANRQVRTRPIDVAVAPDKSLCLGPPPNALYTVTGDYFTAPVSLITGATQDANTTLLPAQYELAIVYGAMMAYGAYEAAPEVYGRGKTEYDKLMARMEHDRLPSVHFGGALA